MTVYMTKTWGFDVPCGPLQFSERGWRDRARDMLSAGDLVVIVGTKGELTPVEEQGMVLGLMEPSSSPVSSLDFDLVRRASDLDDSGNYRWPYGLELRNAWRFSDPRSRFSDLVKRRFGRNSAQGIVELTPTEAAKILDLPREAVPLLRAVRAGARIEGLEAARRRSAPPPSTNRTGVMHMRRAPAFTYAMLVEGAERPAVKIGWAFDWQQRERQFNHTAAPLLGGLRYRTILHALWNTAAEAFHMEQTLLRGFDNLRHSANSEIITPMTREGIERAWIESLAEIRRKKSRRPQ